MPDSHRDSVAWQRAMSLTQKTYELTRTFPKDELFGLTSQMRRCAVSIASNIAEGKGRITPGEFLHFLGLARGSTLELDTQLEVARREAYGASDTLAQAQALLDEVLRLLNSSIATARANRDRQEAGRTRPRPQA